MDWVQSRKIKDYKLILEGLVDEFGLDYYTEILQWCGIIGHEAYWPANQYHEVWLIKKSFQYTRPMGICGLYSLDSEEECWLSWFGIIPQYRNMGYGSETLKWLEYQAKKRGFKKMLSYVDKRGKPLKFYQRNGFERTGTVGELLQSNKQLKVLWFNRLSDHVIQKNIV